jgi:hypothetical protein
LLDAWRQAFPELRLSCIGKIIAGPEVRLRTTEGIRPLVERGYVHFAEGG